MLPSTGNLHFQTYLLSRHDNHQIVLPKVNLTCSNGESYTEQVESNVTYASHARQRPRFERASQDTYAQ